MNSASNSVFALATMTLLAACGGGGGGGGGSNPPPPPPPQAQTYSVTAVALELQRSADGEALPVDSLPAQGATLTID